MSHPLTLPARLLGPRRVERRHRKGRPRARVVGVDDAAELLHMPVTAETLQSSTELCPRLQRSVRVKLVFGSFSGLTY